MRIPEKVKIGGKFYDVIQCEKAIDEVNSDGYCDYHGAVIVDNPEMFEKV